MFYGISSNAWLKRKILYILEEENRFIPSNELTQLVNSCSQSTIKKICRELQEEIKSTYPTGLIELIISQRQGIKLVKQSFTTCQKLLSNIFSVELGYEILYTLLTKRKISMYEFCSTHFISESQVRRKIKDINLSLKKHKIKISLSPYLFIYGSENKLRSFFFSFLFKIHRQFSYMQEIPNKEQILTLAKEIATYLAIDNVKYLEILSLWLFIIDTTQKNKQHLHYTEDERRIIDTLSIPQCPPFLAHWRQEDWEYLILSIYCSDIITMDLEINLKNINTILSLEDITNWISLFETHFVMLSKIERLFVYKKFLKQFLTSSFFITNEEILNEHPASFINELADLYPFFVLRYQKFWQSFIEKAPQNLYLKEQSLLLCFHLVPKEIFLPKVNIYIHSDCTLLYTEYLQFRISAKFQNKYMISFTSEIDTADLILSTTSFEDTTQPPSNLGFLIPIISINEKLSESDFELIESHLSTITAKHLKQKSFYL
ncbi:helix-turn-helix domain-containing protein [Candidatus Enterococcus willemsii]|uniref:Mga helix-turn-helix domain-containing protein n=2 Tax=Enterococcus TaxID=1350 RepID=A0ABQ6YW35_9ENTE|nr:helix-turn-helix domain-containing protein [Enterococcus sp. CU12B]KAF1301728.1 hypothetical protein BAU17_13515 [Enterococcus sp. CU12B]